MARKLEGRRRISGSAVPAQGTWRSAAARPTSQKPSPPLRFRIRRAAASDAPRVLALFREHLRSLQVESDPDLDADMRGFPRAYENSDGLFCLAEDEHGRILGMGGVLDATVRRLHVIGPVRGHGLGRAIVEHLCREHAAWWGTGLRAVVARSNEAARRTFAHCGFVPTTQTPVTGAQRPREIWEKPLAPTPRSPGS